MKTIKISRDDMQTSKSSVSNRTLLVISNVLCLLIIYLIGTPGLRLVGTTIMGSEPIAIFENTESGSQDVFSPNTSVFGKARIVKIEKDSVTLRVNGETFAVRISGFTGDTDNNVNSAHQIETANTTENSIAPNEYISEIAYSDYGDPMVVLSASAISQELGQLSLHVSSSSPQPLIRDGKFVGVTLSNVSENNFLKKVGLQSGDTVKSINGNSFSSPEEALSLLNNSSWANVTIERGGEDVQLSYVVDQNL